MMVLSKPEMERSCRKGEQEAADVGDEGLGGRAFSRAVELLGEAAAASEPGEGAL